jgi:type IV secretory pathway VirB10-like protein
MINLKSHKLVIIAVIAGLALLVCMMGCTSDDQAQEIARQKRIEERQQQEAAAAEAAKLPEPNGSATATQEAQPEERQPQEEEKPVEPKTQTVTTYHFTSSTERGTVDCNSEGKIDACGGVFENCGAHRDETYACQTGVHAWETSKEELVTE